MPGEKFSSSTSARATSFFSRSFPASDFRFSVTPFLLAFSIAIGSVVSPPVASTRRLSGSPRGGSILITVAPAFAISIVA